MDSKIVDEIIEELSSPLERVETQSAAVLEFIKDKGIAKDQDLTPYLERAAAASHVRWRAMRVRLEYLLAELDKSEHKEEGEKKHEETDNTSPAQKTDGNDENRRAPKKMDAEAGEGLHARSDHDVNARGAPKAGEQEGKPSNEGEKQRNAA